MTGMDALSAPQRRGQGWLYTARAPPNPEGEGTTAPEGPRVYRFEEFEVLIRHWLPPKTVEVARNLHAKWFSCEKDQ